MEQRYLIDTNVIIAVQSKTLSPNGIEFVSKIIDSNFNISFISYIEFLCFPNISNESKDFVNIAEVIEINKQIIDTSIEIRRNYKVKLPDTIIAATALVLGLVLITRNTKDFDRVTNLQIINPFIL